MKVVRLFVLFIILGSLPFGMRGQAPAITGQNLCSDGTQKTTIGVTGINADRYYILYQDDKMIQARRLSTKSTDAAIVFGEFSEEGNYAIYEFENAVEGFPKNKGKEVKGNVIIAPLPVLYVKDTLKIKSGSKVNFKPKSNLPETSFSWTSKVKSGMVKGNTTKGSGNIEDMLILENSPSGIVVYSITPFRFVNGTLCTGETRNLIIKVSTP